MTKPDLQNKIMFNFSVDGENIVSGPTGIISPKDDILRKHQFAIEFEIKRHPDSTKLGYFKLHGHSWAYVPDTWALQKTVRFFQVINWFRLIPNKIHNYIIGKITKKETNDYE